MPGSDAGVGASGRLAQGDHRCDLIACGCAAEANGRRRVEEAVSEHADMEGTCRVGEQDPKASTISDHSGKWLKLSGGAIESLADSCGGRAGKPCAGLAIIIISENIFYLPEATFGLNLGAESRAAGTGILIRL
jgi:hypothetical protein